MIRRHLLFVLLLSSVISFAQDRKLVFDSQPEVMQVWKDSVLISWRTNQPSNALLLIDREISDLFTRPLPNVRFDGEMKIEHQSVIRGLHPGKTYVLRVFAFHNSDTAMSSLKVIATQSSSTGKFTVYFTSPVDTTVSTGVNADYLNNVVDDTLVQYINRSQFSLDIAIYNTTNSTSVADIAGAINAAYARGVRVRVIYDGGNSNTMIPNLNAGINRVASPQGGPYNIMHNKFVVIDADAVNPNLPYVWTGSTNWTTSQINGTDKNNVIIVQDQSLALAYKLEFQEMWGDTGLVPNPNYARFGPMKLDNTPHLFSIGGKTVECYFSPSDSVNKHLINTIRTANTDMEFASMVITRTDVADTIIARVNAGVLQTYGLTDDSIQTSTWNILKGGMLPNTMLSHTGQSGIMHNKYLIVDQSNTFSDPLVLTGSHNWSTSANTQNDENTLVVHDATVANLYYQNFVSLFTAHGGMLGTNEPAIGTEFSFYPNPSGSTVTLRFPESYRGKDGLITLYDVQGKEVGRWLLSPGKNEIDISAFSKGIYILQFISGNCTSSKKLVIE